MKVLFLADLHIKYPKKVPKDWQRNRFMLLADEINKVECDLVILGGDTLDSVKPTTAELALFFDFLAQIRHRTIMFSGNHEMQTKTHSILFGAIRLGEEFGDYEQWGDPYEYDLQLGQSIESPV